MGIGTKKKHHLAFMSKSDIIINEISLIDMDGNVVFQKELFQYLSKNYIEMLLPFIEANSIFLLNISTSNGYYSQLINYSTKTILI